MDCPKKKTEYCELVNDQVNPDFCLHACKQQPEEYKEQIEEAKKANLPKDFYSRILRPICKTCEQHKKSCQTGEFCLLRTRGILLEKVYKDGIGCALGKWPSEDSQPSKKPTPPKNVIIKADGQKVGIAEILKGKTANEVIEDLTSYEVVEDFPSSEDIKPIGDIMPAKKSRVIFKRWSGKVVDITDTFKNQTAFLVCNGPSFGLVDKTKLKRPGILTMGMNNGPCKSDFRPDLWTAQDPVIKFLPSIWLDPKIMKFALLDFRNKKLHNPHTKELMKTTLRDCPNLYFHKRHSAFHAERWFDENKIVWGKPKKDGGNRSTMLAAIQILWLLGVTKINLVGCDFYMDGNTRYHFDEYRGPASIKGNQRLFKNMSKYFTELLPYMKANNLEILNCNERSHLKVFPYKNFDEAIAESEIQLDEPSKGMYANK
jgi:hypothetical protein